MRNENRRLVSGRSKIPVYFLGGRNVGTVRSRYVGGNSGSDLAWCTIAALTALWLICPEIPCASNVKT
jgi:hypothetical protein